MIRCPSGRPCRTQDPACYGRLVPHLCDRDEYAGVIAAETARRAADGSPPPAREVNPGPPFAPRPAPPGKVGVAHVQPNLAWGGADRVHLGLARALAADGRFALVGVAAASAEHRHGPTAAELAALQPVGIGCKAIRAAFRTADVVVAWGVHGLAGLMPPDRRARLVLVSHGTCDWTARAVAAAPGAEALVAVCPAAVAPFPAAERARVVVIPNAVDPERVRPRVDRAEQRRAWGVPAGAKVALFLGRFSPEKRPEAVVAALAHLPPDWHAVLVGAGWAADRVRAAAAAPGVAGRAHLPGYSEDVGSALHAADALVLPSREEAQPLAVAEAWLAGVPVVATPVGDLADHPDLARLVPIGADGAAIAAALLADAADPEAAARRAGRARAHAAAELTPALHVRRWADLIANAAGLPLIRPPKPRIPLGTPHPASRAGG